jgi:hypothetical protein
MMDEITIDAVLDAAWEEYDRNSAGAVPNRYVVRPSIPVLWFGDLKRYVSSRLRVITVGLNPSDSEFCGAEANWSCRFPAASNVHSTEFQSMRRDVLRQALNEYFVSDPYRWFDRGFEPLLNGMDASYYSGQATSVAIHTDLCSPLATSPTWSKVKEVSPFTVRDLARHGSRLWNRLVSVLRPHVLVASIGAEWLGLIEYDPGASWTGRATASSGFWLKLPGAPDPTLMAIEHRITSPYKSLSHNAKRELGQELVNSYLAALRNQRSIS